MRRFRRSVGGSVWLGRIAVLLGFLIAIPFIIASAAAWSSRR